MYICPNCSYETDQSSCPKCGAEIGRFLDESVCDITLTGFRDDTSRQKVVEYLLSLSRSKNIERIKRSIEKLPVKIYREIPQYKAEGIVKRFEDMGAQIEARTKTRKVKVDEFFQHEFEESSSGEPTEIPPPVQPSRRKPRIIGAAAVLAVALAAVLYFLFLSPADDQVKEPARDTKQQTLAKNKNKQKIRTDLSNRKKMPHPRSQTKKDTKGSFSMLQKPPSRSRQEGGTGGGERFDAGGKTRDAKKESGRGSRSQESGAEIKWGALLNKRPADLNTHPIEMDGTVEEDLAYSHNQRGVELFGEQKYGEALEEFEAASGESPDREEIVFNVLNTLLTMGYDALSQNNYDEARDVFGRALDYDPNDPFAQKALGITSLLQESYEDATHHLELAFEASEDEADREVLLALGRAYALTNQSGKAIKYLEEYLKLNPSDSQVRGYLNEIKGG